MNTYEQQSKDRESRIEMPSTEGATESKAQAGRGDYEQQSKDRESRVREEWNNRIASDPFYSSKDQDSNAQDNTQPTSSETTLINVPMPTSDYGTIEAIMCINGKPWSVTLQGTIGARLTTE